MEYKIETQTVNTLSTVFKGNIEQSIDLDFNLPDYCPDIQKILKCQAYPKIISKNLNEDKLNIEGITIINLIYLDAEKLTIHSCEHTSPFSASYKLKKPLNTNEFAIFSKPDVEYINCRAITQRRLDIHGAFFVNTEIKVKKEIELTVSVDDENIEQKLESVNLNNLESITQKEFTVNETFELEKELLPIESIINSDLKVKIKDYRAITNKLILNCEALLDVLYINNIETGEINSLKHKYEFSQIIDIENLSEEDIFNIDINTITHDINLKSDATGEAGLLTLDSKFLVNIFTFKNKEIKILTDAYSTLYETSINKKETIIDTFLKQINTEYNHEPRIDLNNLDISRITDLRNELSSVYAIYDGTNIKFTGKYNICILYINLENEISYLEKVIDFEYLYNLNEDIKELILEPNININSIKYSFNENKSLEISTNINFLCSVHKTQNINLIENILADEEKEITKDKNSSLILYYAQANEKIWDISKKYFIPESLIKEENDLSDSEEIIEAKSMLIIPN